MLHIEAIMEHVQHACTVNEASSIQHYRQLTTGHDRGRDEGHLDEPRQAVPPGATPLVFIE